MKQTKTRLEWFNELPEPYRSQAIENTKNDDPPVSLYSYCVNISDALSGGFYWYKSPQGEDYWRLIEEHFCMKSFGGDLTEYPLPEPKETASFFDWLTAKMVFIGSIILIEFAIIIYLLITLNAK